MKFAQFIAFDIEGNLLLINDGNVTRLFCPFYIGHALFCGKNCPHCGDIEKNIMHRGNVKIEDPAIPHTATVAVRLTCGCGTVIYGEKAAIAEGDRNA